MQKSVVKMYFQLLYGISRAHTVVWKCFKDDQQSQWEMLNFDPTNTYEPLKRSSPNLLPDMRDYIMHTFRQEKFGHWAQSIKGFLLPI